MYINAIQLTIRLQESFRVALLHALEHIRDGKHQQEDRRRDGEGV